jgi:hypothetical protein
MDEKTPKDLMGLFTGDMKKLGKEKDDIRTGKAKPRARRKNPLKTDTKPDLMNMFDKAKMKAKDAYKRATTPIPFGSGKPSLNENTRKLLKKVDK